MADAQNIDALESEEGLIHRAQEAISRCNWEVGRCASAWTQRYARGRTDVEFAALVGLSADQVYQRRRVAETFGDTHHEYPALKWSHFYVALAWDNAPECLQWAEENAATVAEMKAWRRAIRGEDLTTEPAMDDFAGDPAVLHVSGEPVVVRDPGDFAEGDGSGSSRINGDRTPTVASAPRDTEDYAPFRSGAGAPPPQGEMESAAAAVAVTDKPSAENIFKRATSSLIRINAALTPEILAEFNALPKKVRKQFTIAVAELSNKSAGLL